MRRINFPIYERAKLVPVDMLYGKYKLLITMFIVFLFCGLDRTGFLFAKMIHTSLFPMVNILSGYLAGIVITPLLLPLIPFRAFALKGAVWGFVCTIILNVFFNVPLLERIALGLIGTGIASFMAMNFTGSSTYTSLSGVKFEMKWSVPMQIVFAFTGLLIFIFFKLL